MLERAVSVVGLLVFIAIGWALCNNRKAISWRLVGWGVALQLIFAVLILKTQPGLIVFDFARVAMVGLLDFSDLGAKFLFGTLVSDHHVGAIVAFKVMPVIIFTSALMGVLTHLNIIQQIIRLMARIMEWTMKASGAEALMAAMFVFMGIEATFGIKDYMDRLTRSEMFTVMVGFMSTIAGSIMAVYVSFGASAGHLLAASVMSAPAAIVMSKLFMPETEQPMTGTDSVPSLKGDNVNVFEAAANGAHDGLKLAATVAAMLISFIALLGMLNHVLGYANTSFELIMGYFFTPFAFIMGVPWEDCLKVGQLLGIKTIFTEFLAYQKMQTFIADGTLAPRSITIATYALCGFSNFINVAVLIGGISTIAPNRKKEVASLCIKALIAATIASFMTATIAGILI